jgi:hypothetical protein
VKPLLPELQAEYGCAREQDVPTRGTAAVGQAIKTPGDTGKTYSLGSWLPSVRVTGRPRPHSKISEDAVMIGLAGFTLFALFMDGWRHNNLTGIDNFWSAAHILMYAGLTGTGVWIAIVLLRYQKGLDDLDWSLVPRGYGLAFIALPLAAIAGPADFMWHSAYGFENQIDSVYSPPHQGLFIAGALLAAIPAAAAWQRRGTVPSLREHLPTLFSVSSVAGVMLFVMHQLVPFYSGVSTTQDFQNDIARFNDAFAPGDKAHHIEGLAKAITHYGDNAFPYYFYTTHYTAAGMFLFTTVLLGAVLLMRRRWRLPFGSLTIMFTWLALLFPLLSEYRQWKLAPALILAGVAGDLLFARYEAPHGPTRVGRIRFVAAAIPPILWALFFLCVQLFEGGLGWHTTVWFGVLVTSAALGYALSVAIFAPFSGPIVEQVPPEPEPTVVAEPEGVTV